MEDVNINFPITVYDLMERIQSLELDVEKVNSIIYHNETFQELIGLDFFDGIGLNPLRTYFLFDLITETQPRVRLYMPINR